MSDTSFQPGSSHGTGPGFRPSTFAPRGSIQTDISVDPGAPVTIFDDVRFSRANNIDTANVAGLAITAAETGNRPIVQYAGPLTLPIEVWGPRLESDDGIGLTPHAVYYLSSAEAGKITPTAPTTPGEFVTPIGFALSADTMMIQIGTAVVVPA